jgi:IS30 family transposase
MELRARGWSIRAAGREVGVSRSAANNWARGYKTYRYGKAVGFVPALDRLAVRQISPRYLSQDERIEIADLRRAGQSIRRIAAEIGRCAAAPATPSTAPTDRLKPTAGLWCVEHVGIVAASRSTLIYVR